MPIEVTMPRLSDTMQQGTIVKWNVKEGQAVKSGDIIADIETDKATMELQSFDEGTVAALTVPAGQTVPVGTVIMVLAAAGEDAASVKAAGGAKGQTVSVSAKGEATSTMTAAATTISTSGGEEGEADGRNGHDGGRVHASPLAKKLAAELGVDLKSVRGSGPGGRIVRRDVEEATAGRAAPTGAARAEGVAARSPERREPAPAPSLVRRVSQTVPLSNVRRIIAERLVDSKRTIPHYQVTVEADMDALMALRGQLNEQLESQGVKLSVNDFLVRACALAMHEHPFVNSRWIEQNGQAAIEQLGQVNIGMAIALPADRGGGLVVGTIRDADRIGLRQISAESRRLAEKARTKGLTSEEMSDSTFTISNLGMFGVAHFTAIINPPNAAILAVGAAMQRPVVKNGQVVPGYVMAMTMSSDHRIIDGAMAAQYLATVRNYLEKPATLLV